MNIRKSSIIGIGVCVLDRLMVVGDHPSADSVTKADCSIVSVGGGIAVAMGTASHLGSSVTMLDRLGHDEASTLIVERLRELGVNVDSISRSTKTTASEASIWSATKTQTRSIVFCPGQELDLELNEDHLEQIAEAEVLHINGRHPRALEKAIRIARDKGTLVSFDGGAHRYRDGILDFVKASDILIVAEHFARAAVDDFDVSIDEICCRFEARFPSAQVHVVTVGDKGCWYRESNLWKHHPAVLSEKTIDTTGCGDAFHGGFLHAWVSGESLSACIETATLAASRQSEVLGSMPKV
ncbi:MAG: carbohydrate kinase family protein [Planctomycetota bacterium]